MIQINSTLPAVINNPFSKNRIISIYVHYSQSIIDSSTWTARGAIEFQNGNTKGEQKFSGDSFDEVVQKMKAVIEQLKSDQ